MYFIYHLFFDFKCMKNDNAFKQVNKKIYLTPILKFEVLHCERSLIPASSPPSHRALYDSAQLCAHMPTLSWRPGVLSLVVMSLSSRALP